MNSDAERGASAPPAPPPQGFLPLFRTSPFLDLVGPLFYRAEGTSFTIGMRVMRAHTNSSGSMHGGLIATLADVSLGYVTAASRKPAIRMTTASLATEYLGAAKLGAWVEAQVSVTKIGKRLAFSDAVISSDGRPIAKARAIFAVADDESTGANPEEGTKP